MFAEVAKVIGAEAAAVLQARFGGSSLYIPVPENRSIAERNAQIRAERAAGAPIQQLMDRYELSRRHIWNILGEK
jgi:Mor family transcriptional regulator